MDKFIESVAKNILGEAPYYKAAVALSFCNWDLRKLSKDL
jgi:hypothetical protein